MEKIDPKKQREQSASTLIHSLRASVMHHVLINLEKAGIAAMLTDDYCIATHIADLEKLKDTLRKNFVNVLSQDILGRIYGHVCSVVKDPSQVPLPPKKGDLDLNEVFDSEFAFN